LFAQSYLLFALRKRILENLLSVFKHLHGWWLLFFMKSVRTISPAVARRLAIKRQHLANSRPRADSEGVMDVMRDLRYLQVDPMRVVAPSHLLVLWSRLGRYDTRLVDRLLWEDRRLFEDWAQATSIVLTEDYPIFKALKHGFAAGDSSWARKIRDWMEKNREFRDYILEELDLRGPLLSSQFEDKAVLGWSSSGWTTGRNVDMMLSFLKAQGRVMVAGRTGNQRLWDLTEHFLPEWTPKEELSDREVVRRAAQLSLRALGVAKVKHIERHFIRGCYSELEGVLNELEAEGHIMRVEICEGKKPWPGSWLVHVNDLPLLDSLEGGDWEPRTTMLSPFDNLISDRKRTEQLFGFSFRFEVYVPKNKREYGCYVMPILHGDRFIGRIDPVMDRKKGKLMINAVYAESDAPKSKNVARAVATAGEELGEFLGADKVCYGSKVPEAWRKFLH
jgi:hypothetical protein